MGCRSVLKQTTIFIILTIILYGGIFQKFDQFYKDLIGNNTSCLSNEAKDTNLDEFSSISKKAIKKLEEIDQEEIESSWIPFIDTKESLREDFNEILDDLIISLTGNSRVLLCLKEMRKKSREIIAKQENIREIRANSIGNISEDDKNSIKESLEKIYELQKDIEKIRGEILKELNSLGIKLSQNELKALLIRVDSDDILEMMAIFDIAKKITSQLQKLIEKNRGDVELSKRYYGMNLVLSETALYIQEKYIYSINSKYIPRLKKIVSKVQELLKETETLQKRAKSDYEKKIYSSNLKSQTITLKTAQLYIKNLQKQREQVEIAKQKSIDNLNITRNSYKTLKVGVNLLELIQETKDSFKRVMTIQFPKIEPFQNEDIEKEYYKLTEEIKE